MEWSASSTASSIVFPYHFIYILFIYLFLFCYFQYENEVKIISKWTNNKLTRPRFSDAAGEVTSSNFNPFFRAVVMYLQFSFSIACEQEQNQI